MRLCFCFWCQSQRQLSTHCPISPIHKFLPATLILLRVFIFAYSRTFNASLTFPFLRTFLFGKGKRPLSLSNGCLASPTTSWITFNAEGLLKDLYPTPMLVRIHRDRVSLEHSDARSKN
jgi:hypothetical protein